MGWGRLFEEGKECVLGKKQKKKEQPLVSTMTAKEDGESEAKWS